MLRRDAIVQTVVVLDSEANKTTAHNTNHFYLIYLLYSHTHFYIPLVLLRKNVASLLSPIVCCIDYSITVCHCAERIRSKNIVSHSLNCLLSWSRVALYRVLRWILFQIEFQLFYHSIKITKDRFDPTYETWK